MTSWFVKFHPIVFPVDAERSRKILFFALVVAAMIDARVYFCSLLKYLFCFIFENKAFVTKQFSFFNFDLKSTRHG